MVHESRHVPVVLSVHDHLVPGVSHVVRMHASVVSEVKAGSMFGLIPPELVFSYTSMIINTIRK